MGVLCMIALAVGSRIEFIVSHISCLERQLAAVGEELCHDTHQHDARC